MAHLINNSIAIIAAFCIGLVNAAVVTVMWGWFVTVATGLPPIGFWNAFGVLMMISWIAAMKGKVPDTISSEEKLKITIEKLFIAGFAAPVVLAIGYLVKTFGM